MTNERLRSYLSFIRSVQKLPHKEKTKAMLDDTKRFVRGVLREGGDPLFRSLRDHFFSEIFDDHDPYAWRGYAPDGCWDSWTRYTIVYDGGLTDAEIDGRVEALRMETHSAFDCSGRPFTISLRWKRIPCGIAIIHHIGLDV